MDGAHYSTIDFKILPIVQGVAEHPSVIAPIMTNQYSVTMTVYSDSTCREALLDSNEAGTYQLLGGRRVFHAQATKASWISRSDMVSAGLSKNNECGISNWITGRSFDVLNTTCRDNTQSDSILNSLDENDNQIELVSCENIRKPSADTCLAIPLFRVR